MENNPLLQAALEYAARGWHVVPICEPTGNGCSCPKGTDCPSPGKHPRIKAWQRNSSISEELIAEWWERWPSANVGIQWGRRSGIIDMECDSAQAEKDWLRLWDDSPPACPIYEADRGKHRVLEWRSDLPGGAVLHFGELEIRTGNGDRGAQSVVPPSSHASGKRYRWLVTPDEAPPVTIPDHVMVKLWNQAGEPLSSLETTKRWRTVYDQAEIHEGVDKRDDTFLSFACREAQRSPNIDDPQEQKDLYLKLEAFNAMKCQPRLSDADLQRIHTQAINYTRRDRSGQRRNDFGYTVHGLKYEEGVWLPGEWELLVVRSEPVEYRLRVPRWEKYTRNGMILLTLDQYRDHDKMASKVQETTKVVVLDDTPRVWASVWNGRAGSKKDGHPPRRGLRSILLDCADHVEAPSELVRSAVVAWQVAEYLSGARSLREDQKVDTRGPPCRLPDGTVIVRPDPMLEELSRKAVKITPREIADLFERTGVRNHRPREEGGRRPRLKKASPAVMAKIEAEARLVPPVPI